MSDLIAACSAYVISRSEAQSAELERLARRLGFLHVQPLFSRHGFGPSDNTPKLGFFLVYRHLADRVMLAVRNLIRASDDPTVRYAPIILFTEDCDFEAYTRYVRLGFDDVLTLPDKREMLVARLEHQIKSEHVYFETDDYLGPDRRRMEVAGSTDPRRGGEPRSFSRHIVRRSVETGAQVARTEFFVSSSLLNEKLNEPALSYGQNRRPADLKI